MVMKPHQKLWVGAVSALLVGGVAAAQIYHSQPETSPASASTLRQLAERVSADPLPTPGLLVPPVVTAPDPEPAPVRPRIRPKQPAPVTPPAPVETEETRAAQARAASAELVKNIALMGITHQGADDQVWLVDLSNNERSVVGEGEDAFAFTVRDIADEHVLLARGPDEFSIYLGEKQIPVTTEEGGSSGSGPGGFGPGGFGPGGNGWGNGNRRAMMMGALAAMSGARGGGGGGWSGNRGGWGGGWSGSSSFNRNRSNGWGNGGFRPTFNAGGFRPGGFGGGGGNFNQGGNRNSGVQLSTSNPQTARRRGSRLVGGGDPMPVPAAVSNPQTMRRRGTTSGQAFGDSSNSSRSGQRSGTSSRNSGR